MWSLILGYIGICHTLPSIVRVVGFVPVSISSISLASSISSRCAIGGFFPSLSLTKIPVMSFISRLCSRAPSFRFRSGLLSRFLYCRHVLLSIGVRRSLVLFVVVLGFLLGCLHDYKYTTLYLRVPLAYGRRL